MYHGIDFCLRLQSMNKCIQYCLEFCWPNMSYFLRFPSFVIYAENTIESIRQKLTGEQTAKETIKGGLMKVKRE